MDADEKEPVGVHGEGGGWNGVHYYLPFFRLASDAWKTQLSL